MKCKITSIGTHACVLRGNMTITEAVIVFYCFYLNLCTFSSHTATTFTPLSQCEADWPVTDCGLNFSH